MIKIGLTGLIGSGKSTVARMARDKLLIPVFDADDVIHHMYESDEKIIAEIVTAFGEGVLKPDVHAIDHTALRDAFRKPANAEKWQVIRTDVLRRVTECLDAFMAEQEANGEAVAMADIPFLFEQERQNQFDYTMNVWVPADIQKQRVLARAVPAISEQEFETRMKMFLPAEERNRLADFVIDNSVSPDIAFSIFQTHLKTIEALEAPKMPVLGDDLSL